MIKIDGVDKSKDIKTSGSVKKAGSSNFSSFLDAAMGVKNNPVSATANVAMVGNVFAAQMVDERLEQEMKRELVKRGKNLLEKLEEIRDALLLGEISKDKLMEISRFVRTNKPEVEDARLKEIINEIELRVEVEIAKFTR